MLRGGNKMNPAKIGKFIAECRKAKNLTQAQLAEKLCITDRAVSKWENGRSLPDTMLMLDLCKVLEINVNDLLNGEMVMDNYKEKAEELLLEMAKQKAASDKRLLFCEILIGVFGIIILLVAAIMASYVQMEEWLRIIIVILGLIPLLVATPFMLKIEQVAGYYECKECGHRYVPEYKSVFWAPHMGRTRKMKCPKCGKKTWQKKVINKE